MQKDKKLEEEIKVTQLLLQMTEINRNLFEIKRQLEETSIDIQRIQSRLWPMEYLQRNEYETMKQEFNNILNDISHHSVNQKSVVNKIKVSIEIQKKELFVQQIQQLNNDENAIIILNKLIEFVEKLMKFLKEIDEKFIGKVKFWGLCFGFSMGAISIVNSIKLKNLLGTGVGGLVYGIVATGGMFSFIILKLLYLRYRLVPRLQYLKDTLIASKNQINVIKDCMKGINERSLFVDLLFQNINYRKLIGEEIVVINNFDNLLVNQISE